MVDKEDINRFRWRFHEVKKSFILSSYPFIIKARYAARDITVDILSHLWESIMLTYTLKCFLSGKMTQFVMGSSYNLMPHTSGNDLL